MSGLPPGRGRGSRRIPERRYRSTPELVREVSIVLVHGGDAREPLLEFYREEESWDLVIPEADRRPGVLISTAYDVIAAYLNEHELWPPELLDRLEVRT